MARAKTSRATSWPHRHKLTSILLSTCLILSFVIVIRCSSDQHASATSRSNESNNKTSSPTTNGARIQARVSLESKSFDLVDESATASEASVPRPSQVESTSDNSTTTKRIKKTSAKSGRRLSNIWSMFLPSSSANEDYESAADEEPESGSSGGLNAAGSSSAAEEAASGSVAVVTSASVTPAPQPPSTNKTSGESETAELNNERLVAKLARPVSGGSGDDAPVRLITGALGSGPAPNMNEIVSNIMGSMNASGTTSFETSTTQAPSSDNKAGESLGEQEDSDPEQPASGANKTTTSDGDQFERWLNRIKLQQSPSGSSRGSAPTSGSSAVRQRPTASSGENNNQKPLKASAAWHLQRTASVAPDGSTKSATSKPITTGIKWPQPQNSSSTLDGQAGRQQAIRDLGTKGQTSPMRTRATQPQQQQQQQQFFDAYQKHLSTKHQSQHPFQQQMRQQQAQLIHGIKHPLGQASTISLSTAVEGASNTSLAFGSHYIPQLNPIESSQVVNSSSSSPAQLQTPTNHNVASAGNSSSEAPAIVEQQNIYQSQDEILRQVTSAINFEQQQLMMNQQQNLKKESSEVSQRELMDDNRFMTAYGNSRLSPASSSGNATTGGDRSTATTTPESILKPTSGNSTTSRPLDVDKSFDLLAERVRQLAGQQQNLQQALQATASSTTNGNSSLGQQPSWLLTRPDINQLSNLLAASKPPETGGGSLANSNEQINLDQIRELLQRHERTKSELKSSQESMMQLMQQMMQLKQQASTGSAQAGPNAQSQSQRASTTQPSTLGHQNSWTREGPSDLNQLQQSNLLSDDRRQSGENSGGVQHFEQMARPPPGTSNVGWQPSNGQPSIRQQQQPPVSPANLMKGRVRFPSQQQQMRPPMHADEIDPSDLMDQQIIGLPIALLNNNNNNNEIELSHGQLEEAARVAAEQLGALPPPPASMKHTHHLQRAANKPPGNAAFLPRAAPNQVAQNRQQQADHLGHNQPLSSSQFQTELQQQQQNLAQIEKLVSLLPPSGNQPTSWNGARPFSDGTPTQHNQPVNHTGRLEAIANLLSNRPMDVELLAAFNRDRMNKEESQTTRNEQNAANNKTSTTNRVVQEDQAAVAPQKQQQESLQQVDLNQQPPPHLMGHYGQVPRPGSESFIRELRPLLGPTSAYAPVPPRVLGLHTAADEGSIGHGLVTTTTMTGATGPPIKMREISLHRPFGFRGHHALSYQASPAVAAIFPRLIGQPAGQQQQVMLLQQQQQQAQQSMRPGILRHMTPIRATLSEGQRLISQMLPPQLTDHLGHYHHRFHSHQYPSHTNLGTLPIPPMRHHHALLSHPIRRSHLGPHGASSPHLRHLGHNRARSWPEAPTRNNNNERGRQNQNNNLVSQSRMRVRHMEPEAEAYQIANNEDDEVHQLLQLDDELVLGAPPEEETSPMAAQIHSPNVVGEQQGLLEGEQLGRALRMPPTQQQVAVSGPMLRSRRPSRQMSAPLGGHITDRLASLRVDMPSTMVPITQPCIPPGLGKSLQPGITIATSPTPAILTTSPPATFSSTSTNSTPDVNSTTTMTTMQDLSTATPLSRTSSP